MIRCLILAVVLCALPASAHGSAAHPDPHAERLYRSALGDLARNTIDTRRRAIASLEQATLIDRDNPGYELMLARAYFQCGFLKLAQRRFDRVARLDPDDAEGHYGLGLVWRRDWLKYLERASLDRAIEQFSAAARLKPSLCDPWLQLVPLLVERGDIAAAAGAAERAGEADPRRPEAVLARAHCAYRSGDLRLADSLFRAALPRLPRLARERFEDISPVATARDTFTLHRLSPADQREFIARFWRENDPDLSTPENEALIEYWSRVAQAYFLYFDPHRREWDERGEVYVRYGPPAYATYNPLGAPLEVRFRTGPPYPANSLVWDYPDLGMSVQMQDRLLSEYYLLPITEDFDPDPVPDPAALEGRPDRIALSGGRGVFLTLPPGVRPLPIHGEVARFLGDRGPRLIADVDVAGGPADSLQASWAVLDTASRELLRGTRALTPSACDPAERRVADFAADLPPGNYRVGLTVRGAGSRRGVYRVDVTVPPRPAGLALSDVVVTCGPPAPGDFGPGVRLEPNPEARIGRGDPVTAYFEIYHLSPDSAGEARFEYDCTVRSQDRDPRIWVQRLFAPHPRLPDISATREVITPGGVRRQFVTVPVQALPPGHYRLEIRVRDLISGGETAGAAIFLKGEGLPLRN